MGRQPLPGAGPRRLAAKPSDFRLLTSGMGSTLYRPLRIYGKRIAPSLQRQVARPQVRGRRLSTPAGRRMATRSELLQPLMGRTTLRVRKATPVGPISHRHRIALIPQTMVSTTTKHGHQDHPLPRLTRHALPRTARLARGGRTTRMERRGTSTATPA
jgi:hypothetical protein